jgi:hypothetical protein
VIYILVHQKKNKLKTTKLTLIPSPLARGLNSISTVYHYREIRLYPVAISSTWPFPVHEENVTKFKQAIVWLKDNNVSTMGTSEVDYNYCAVQTVLLKFTSEEDLTAFTLQFGELMV